MRSWHCRHCGTPRSLHRPSLRKWRLEKLLLVVRAQIVQLEAGAHITAEAVATALRASKPMVEQCFHRLNLEGLLSTGVNWAPHDSTRDPWRWGKGDSAWCATTYIRR